MLSAFSRLSLFSNREELAENVVCEFLSEKLARYKVPKVIEFRGELPREDSGKIFKRKLRAPYWEKTGRQI